MDVVEPSVALENACLDLVTEHRNEPDVRALLTEHQAGEWVSLYRIHNAAKPKATDAARFDASGVFVTWLPDPTGDPSFVLILFFDDCSKWSAAAQYNRSRLLRPGEDIARDAAAAQGAVAR